MKPRTKDGEDRAAPTGVGDFFQDHPGAFIAIVAAFLNGVGLVYGSFSLAALDINYFDFAEVDDFLISAFRNIWMLIYSCVAAITGIFLFPTVRRLRFWRSLLTAYVAATMFLVPWWLGERASDPESFFSSNTDYTRVLHEGDCREDEEVNGKCLLTEHKLVTKVGDFLVFANRTGDAVIIRRSDVVQIYEGN